MRIPRRLLLGAVALLSALTLPTLALDPSGEAVLVNPDATGQLGGPAVTLIKGSDIFPGQRISTGSAGQVQIVFSDETRLVVGPRSNLVIENYLMRRDGSVTDFTLNTLGGSFRFITGNSTKDAYTIKTPTGTMGVRGTVVDWRVNAGSGRTDAVVLEGAVTICAPDGKCRTLERVCEIGSLVSRTGPALITDAATRSQIGARSFPYVGSQSSLRRDFRVRVPEGCLGAAEVTVAGVDPVPRVKPEKPDFPKPPHHHPKPDFPHHGKPDFPHLPHHGKPDFPHGPKGGEGKDWGGHQGGRFGGFGFGDHSFGGHGFGGFGFGFGGR